MADATQNNPVKEISYALVGIVAFLVMVLFIAVSAFLRPAGEHVTPEATAAESTEQTATATSSAPAAGTTATATADTAEATVTEDTAVATEQTTAK